MFGALGASFAALNAIGNGFSILQVLFQRSAMSHQSHGAGSEDLAQSMRQLDGMVEATTKLTISNGIAMIVMDVALIIISVMLIQRRDLGRKLAIAWAVTAFAVLIGRAISFELIMVPALSHFMSGMGSNGGGTAFSDQTFNWVARGGNLLSLGFMALFPISLLVAMNLASVKRTVRQPFELG